MERAAGQARAIRAARGVCVLFLVLGVSLCLGVPAQGANGSLDTSFGTGGTLTNPIGSSADQAKSVAIQADGKIVTAGYAYNAFDDDFALARYNSDGSPDTSFDTDGKVTTSFGPSYDEVYSVAIQGDGKIVAAGLANHAFALARYNTDGSLDTSFDTDGKVTTSIAAGDNRVFSVAIQADGKIVAAGYSYNGNDYDFTLARYNTDGSLDTSFDTDGKVTTSLGSPNDFAHAVVIQADGKIVAAGSAYNGSNHDVAVARYNTDGSLDTSFGTGGKVMTPISSEDDVANSVVIQADGKIVAAGYASNGIDFALARYNTDGSLDTSFGTGGKVATRLGLGGLARSVAVQADGKIVAAGSAYSGSSDDFAVARYNTDGSLDTSFGTRGKVLTPVGSASDYGSSVTIQASDGKVVVAGYAQDGSAEYDFALVRYIGNAVATHLSVTAPREVPAGSNARVTGRLTSADPTCVASQQVKLIKGRKPAGKATTTATGAYRFLLKITDRTTVQVVYVGPGSCGSSVSARKTIRAG